jgi:hypothetical protein
VVPPFGEAHNHNVEPLNDVPKLVATYLAHGIEGYEASFLVLAGDPLEDFGNVTRITRRVKQGKRLP